MFFNKKEAPLRRRAANVAGAARPRCRRASPDWCASRGGSWSSRPSCGSALILATYSRGDPGWSFSGSGAPIANKGGVAGAWLADLLLYLFGLSAWWWVVAGIVLVVAGYRRIGHPELATDHPLSLGVLGFALVLLTSAALEALRFYRLPVALPQAPGGALGDIVGRGLATLFGFNGATLLLLALFAAGSSLFFGMSWLKLMERVGAGIEGLVTRVKRRAEERKDREIGAQALAEREAVVQAKHEIEIDEREPVVVVPQTVEVPKSERVVKEKQRPLFVDMPDSPLPPLALLDDAPSAQEMVSAETLEFTSRLIERKLADFGVAVKVLAAYPGPVITRYEIEPAVGVKGAQIVNLMKDLARALSVISIRVVETIPGKSCMGLELPNPKRQIVKLVEILSSATYNDNGEPADARARQGHRRQARDRRPRADAAPARRRHHRLRQVGRGQRDDPVAALQGRAEAGAPDLHRSEDARAFRVRRHSAPAGAGRHRHEARRQRAQLVRRRDGAPLPADVDARRAQSRRLQREGRRGEEGRQAARRIRSR